MSSNFSVCFSNAYGGPIVSNRAEHPQIPIIQVQCSRRAAYSLLPRIGDVLVGLEEGPYVDGLAAPKLSMHGPVESQLQ